MACGGSAVGSSRTYNKNPALRLAKCWVLATSYSRTACRRTTIGAAAFHFRVRNGNGWGHCVIVTRAKERLRCSALVAVHRTAMAIEVNRRYLDFKEHRFPGNYIQEEERDSRSVKSLHQQTAHSAVATTIRDSRFNDSRNLNELRFVLRSFVSSVC